MLETLTSFGPFVTVVTAVGLILWAAHWLLIKRNPDIGNEQLFPRQLMMLGLSVFGLLATILVLPVSDSSRNQLIGLLGILLSGMFAFSSTTVTSNLMAGLLLRITKPFRVGDFIRVGDHFGRVSERGLFDTEIQSETRELIALPNSYCISNPVTTIRSSGTIISASLSLGYDINRNQIESLLMEAAESCGLAEPFVHILELGNFSVTYRVSGFLEDTKRLISSRSQLYGCVLDTLHGNDIEIMSPTFMNQRRLADEVKTIPSNTSPVAADEEKSAPEDIAFDKAEQAEQLENEKLQLAQEIENLEAASKQDSSDADKKARQDSITERRERLKALNEKPKQEEPD